MNNRQQVSELVSLVENGRVIDAFDKFYGDTVTMQENANPPTVGKAANRVREQKFVDSIAEFHVGKAKSVLVDGDECVIAWELEYTNQEGQRLRLDQLAHQKWQDGKIVSEKFYYDSAAVLQ